MKTMGFIKPALLVAGIVQLTSCSNPAPAAKAQPFAEEAAADFIAWYYCDDTSYALKPALMEGAYQSVCDRALLLKLAGRQPRRDLAVVVLIHYPSVVSEDAVKLAWVNDLKGLGYQRIVFLRGGNHLKVNGLPVVESPQAPATFAGK